MTGLARSLKAENAWLIRAVLVLHAVAFAYVAFEPFVVAQLAGADVREKIKVALAPGTLSLAIIVLAKLVLLGLVPARLRDQLIHWRWRHPLPGSRAFTSFGPAEVRVDLAALEQRFGPLPTDSGRQNQLFYKVYRAHADEVGVLDAHKSYLAARDIGIINLILFILLPGFAWWATWDPERVALYSGVLFASYALTALAAQMYAARFVENVLASASSKTNAA
jgi:hypothetical protein